MYDIETYYNSYKDISKLQDITKRKTDGIFYPGRLYYIERMKDTDKMYNAQIIGLCISCDIQNKKILMIDLCKIMKGKRLKLLKIIIKSCYNSLSEELESMFSDITDCYCPELNKESTLRIFSDIFDIKAAIKTLFIKDITLACDISWADSYKIIDLCDKSLIMNGNIIQYQTI